MRAMFGIVGILIAVGVIVWFMGKGGLEHTQKTLETGQKAREQVSQIAGTDTESGKRVSESADLEPLTTGGKLTGILVTRVVPDGAYAKYFGLKRNDTIVAVVYQANRMEVRDMDAEMATVQVEEAYRHGGSVVVVRDEKSLTLPAVQQAPAPAAAPKKNDGSPLQQQLDAIPGVR